MKISTSFRFKTPKKQIEEEINRLKRSWKESNIDTLEWNKKYEKFGSSKPIMKPYGLIVTVEIYNEMKIMMDIPYVTPDYILKVKINKNKKSETEIFIVDEKEFKTGNKKD